MFFSFLMTEVSAVCKNLQVQKQKCEHEQQIKSKLPHWHNYKSETAFMPDTANIVNIFSK